ncbi:MAG: transporter substrate-binding domain-containing protein [Pseudomonadota bacterium]
MNANLKSIIRRKLIPVALAAACALAVSAEAAAQNIADLIKKGKVTIGVVSGAPPFGSVDAKGVPVGYDVDVANLIGKYIGLKVDVVPLTSPARIPALESGKVDFLVATMAPTPERAKVVMFSNPYNAFELSIIGPTGSKLKTMADLGKKKVGVPRGTTQDTALTRLAVAGTNIVRFEDDATTAQALLSGQVDAVALPNISAADIVKTRGAGKIELKFGFALQPNSMALRKDQFELHQWLNNFIYYVKQNGELDAIARKWTGNALPPLPAM